MIGKLAVDLARDQQMTQLLTMKPLQELQKFLPRHEGLLLKVNILLFLFLLFCVNNLKESSFYY